MPQVNVQLPSQFRKFLKGRQKQYRLNGKGYTNSGLLEMRVLEIAAI